MKNPIADAKRQLAKQLRDAANGILNTIDPATGRPNPEKEEELNKNARLQISAIIGKLEAGILEGTADVLDYLSASDYMKPEMQQRQKQMEDFDAVRRAAANATATGDWTKYDEVVNGLVDRLIAGRQQVDGSGTQTQPGA